MNEDELDPGQDPESAAKDPKKDPSSDPVKEPKTPPKNGAEQIPGEAPDDTDEDTWNALPTWIRDLRKENASRRKKIGDLTTEKDSIQTQLQALLDKDKSEEDKNKERLQKLESQDIPALLRTNQELTVKLHASQHDLVDPDAVVKLLDWDRVAKGEDIDTLLTELVEEKPWLKKPEPSTVKTPPKSKSSPASPPNPTAPTTSVSRSALKNMSPDEINEAWESGDLQTQLKSGRVEE